MLRTLIIGVALFAGAFHAGAAYAQATGTTTLGNLSYTLVDLDPNDGITPSLTWGAWPVNSPHYAYDNGGVDAELRNGWEGHGPRESMYVPGPTPAEVSLSSDYMSAYGLLHQRESQDTVEMILTPSADMGDSDVNRHARLFAYSSGAGFQLSANTRVVFTVEGHASGSVTRGDEFYERFQTYNYLYLWLGWSDYQYDFDLFTVESAEGAFNPEGEHMFRLSVTADNASGDPVSGKTGFWSGTEAISMVRTAQLPAPIPEPDALPLYLAGLGIIATWARRRKPR